MPRLYEQEKQGGNAVIHLKLFTPDANWTWYITEADAVLKSGDQIALKDVKDWSQIEDIIMFGLIDGLEKEMGYVSFSEIKEVHGPLGLSIERDRHFPDGTRLFQVAPEKFPAPGAKIKKS